LPRSHTPYLECDISKHGRAEAFRETTKKTDAYITIFDRKEVIRGSKDIVIAGSDAPSGALQLTLCMKIQDICFTPQRTHEALALVYVFVVFHHHIANFGDRLMGPVLKLEWGLTRCESDVFKEITKRS
jgi:hypothetical protein